MSLRSPLALLLCAVGLALPLAAAAQPAASSVGKATPDTEQPTLQDDKATIEATRKWLELIDAGKPGDAWDHTAASMKSAVTRDDWISGLSDIRKQFGKLVSRKPTRFARAHQMPNAPDGDYAIVEYESVFADGKSAAEQITWKLEDDGVFRVSGYFIR